MVYDSLGSRSASWTGKIYVEIAETAARNGSILVVPVGSVEQHGFHMPVGTDTILVDAVAHRSVERVETEVPVLITPSTSSKISPIRPWRTVSTACYS